MRRPLGVLGVLFVVLATHEAPADATRPTPVRVTVVGGGEIRLIVSDGTSLPCDASGNHLLYGGHAKAGDTIDLRSLTGSVCVDHTYGALRESQWAGASIWSGSGAFFSGARALDGAVSTDEP